MGELETARDSALGSLKQLVDAFDRMDQKEQVRAIGWIRNGLLECHGLLGMIR